MRSLSLVASFVLHVVPNRADLLLIWLVNCLDSHFSDNTANTQSQAVDGRVTVIATVSFSRSEFLSL